MTECSPTLCPAYQSYEAVQVNPKLKQLNPYDPLGYTRGWDFNLNQLSQITYIFVNEGYIHFQIPWSFHRYHKNCQNAKTYFVHRPKFTKKVLNWLIAKMKIVTWASLLLVNKWQIRFCSFLITGSTHIWAKNIELLNTTPGALVHP